MSKPPVFILPIIIDTREQHPYDFPRMIVQTLKTGDYSVKGYEDQIAVERKTKPDAYHSLGQGRERFQNEFIRLSQLKFAAVVVETSIPEFLNPPPFTKMDPHAAINSLISWMVKYKVCVVWAGDRKHGNALTYRILEKFWRSLQK